MPAGSLLGTFPSRASMVSWALQAVQSSLHPQVAFLLKVEGTYGWGGLRAHRNAQEKAAHSARADKRKNAFYQKLFVFHLSTGEDHSIPALLRSAEPVRNFSLPGLITRSRI